MSDGLTQTEVEVAQQLIDATVPGRYRVKEIYGVSWPSRGATSLGKRFKASVKAGALSRIRFAQLLSDNHNTYDVS